MRLRGSGGGRGASVQGGTHALPEMPGGHDNRIARVHALELAADFAREVFERVSAGEDEPFKIPRSEMRRLVLPL